MKMAEATKIMKSRYMVSFERVEGKILKPDYFPDKNAGEELIATETEAWTLAVAFAHKTKGKCINIYVVNADFTPVQGYKRRKMKNR